MNTLDKLIIQWRVQRQVEHGRRRRPSGFPMVTTSEPTATPPPRVAGTTTSGSFLGVSAAMSIFGSAAVTVAAALVPSAKRNRDAATAGHDVVGGEHDAGVGDDQAGAEGTFEVVISTTDGTTCRYRSVIGSGVAVAAGLGVGVGVAEARLAEVAEPDPSLNASAAMITMATMRTPAAETAQRQPAPRRMT